MDISTYRLVQESGWVRAQCDRLNAGGEVTCPAESCPGTLAIYEVHEAAGGYVDGLPAPCGVLCHVCGLRSRPVAL